MQPSEKGSSGERMLLLMEDDCDGGDGGNTVLIHPSQCFTRRERSEGANFKRF